MKWSVCGSALVAMAFVGCGIGRAITAPVRYVFSGPEPTPARSTSDVTNPGHPVAGSARATPRVAANKPSPKPLPSVSAAQFSVAKPVPGKPGLVFNPFNANGGYIDVSGFAPGSKVKDPESHQIFIVP